MLSKSYWMFLGGAVGLIMGFFGTFFGFDQLRLAMHASEKPERVRLADLDARAPGDNIHVALTDFTPLWQGTWTDAGSENGASSQVWVPLAPAGGRQPPRPQDVRAVILLNGIRDSADLGRALDGRPLVGLIKSRGGYDQWQDLRERNPGICLEQCWVVWEGHQPWTARSAMGLVAAAILLFALGFCLVVAAACRPAPLDANVQHVMLMTSPLVLLIGVMARWLRGRRWLSAPAAAALLAGTGCSLFVLGGVVIWRSGFSPFDGLTGASIGGSFLLDVGFGLLVCGCVCAVKAGRRTDGVVEGLPEADDTAGPEEQRKKGGRHAAAYLLGGGVGLLLAGVAWLKNDPASASTAAVLIGAGVTACVLGLFLLLAGQQAGVEDMPDSERLQS